MKTVADKTTHEHRGRLEAALRLSADLRGELSRNADGVDGKVAGLGLVGRASVARALKRQKGPPSCARFWAFRAGAASPELCSYSNRTTLSL